MTNECFLRVVEKCPRGALRVSMGCPKGALGLGCPTGDPGSALYWCPKGALESPSDVP